MATPQSELIAAGGQALGTRAWDEARASYERALESEETADALEGLAIAAWWQDDVDTAIESRERAYVLRREQGRPVEAARLASFLAWDYGAMRGVNAVANGWLQRARRLIGELPPSPEHGWLPLIEASFHLDTDAAAVLRLSREAAEHAHTHGALDIEMTALTLQGLALVSLGQGEEGTRLLDEGTAAATAGELYDPIAIGSCCCNMIIACERARDYDRAGQWCAQLAGFCERTGQRPLLSLCRAHHGTVLMVRGEWTQAEAELEWAAGELSTLRPPLARYARARFAELRRRQGRTEEARELAALAAGHVLAPLLQAALALDAGDAAAALGHAERYLRGLGPEQPIESAAGLEVLVPVQLRLGDIAGAHATAAEIAKIAHAVGTDPLHAAALLAAGRVAVAERDTDTARRAFEDAIDLFLRTVAPFEAAQARLELAEVLRGDPGREQALAAKATFEELGAKQAARQADALLRRLAGRRANAEPAGLTKREAEVLTLVAAGLSNRQIADRLVLSEHTVHRHMANIYVRLGVSTRAAAVARAGDLGLLKDGPNGR